MGELITRILFSVVDQEEDFVGACNKLHSKAASALGPFLLGVSESM